MVDKGKTEWLDGYNHDSYVEQGKQFCYDEIAKKYYHYHAMGTHA